MTPSPADLTPAAPSAGLMIPAAAVAIDGVEPAEGDEITATVTLRVTGRQGDQLAVDPVALNGQPIAAPAAPMDDDAAMYDAAREADGMGY